MEKRTIVIIVIVVLLLLGAIKLLFTPTVTIPATKVQHMIRSTDTGSTFKNILMADDAGNLDVTAIDDLPFKIKTSGDISGNSVTGNSIVSNGTAKMGGINLTNNTWKDTANATTSEICNDTNSYKTLMIIGNSSGGANRKVSIWDQLTVNGTFCIGNTCINEDDLKKVKNNSFPSISTNEVIVRSTSNQNDYTKMTQNLGGNLSLTSGYNGNANINYYLNGDPNIQIQGKRAVTTGTNINVNNIFSTNDGYLHNRSDFQQRNGVWFGL